MELFMGILVVLVIISASLAIVSMMSVRELAKEVDDLAALVKRNL